MAFIAVAILFSASILSAQQSDLLWSSECERKWERSEEHRLISELINRLRLNNPHVFKVESPPSFDSDTLNRKYEYGLFKLATAMFGCLNGEEWIIGERFLNLFYPDILVANEIATQIISQNPLFSSFASSHESQTDCPAVYYLYYRSFLQGIETVYG